jgi:hypothetical protein
MTEPLTLDKLNEIERGLEGVTPGPWRVSKHRASSRAIQTTKTDREIATVALHKYTDNTGPEAMAAHIARLDPETVRELVRGYREWMGHQQANEEALQLRLGKMGSYPGGRTKDEWDAIARESYERAAHLPED